MGLYELVDEISNRQILKTEGGDNRIIGILIGIVESNYDKDHPGKICVRIPVRDVDANVLKWAKVAAPMSGEKWGVYWIPEVGDEVLVAFEQGNIEKPFVLGCIPKEKSVIVKNGSEEKNRFKDIQSRFGTLLRYTDDVKNEGEEDKLEFIMVNKKMNVIIDNKTEEFLLYDKDSENKIALHGDDKKGLLEIKLAKKLEMKIGDKISVIMNGTSGAVEITSDTFKVKTSKNIMFETDGATSYKGKSIKLDAGSSLELASSGTAKVTGSVIQLG